MKRVKLDRKLFVQVCQKAPNLLLDPDTGICSPRARPSACHLSPDEVEAIVAARRDKLTVVYDKSFARRRTVDDQLTDKLRDFKQRGLHGFAYRSHAHFIFLSRDRNIIRRARDLLIDARMPECRFTPLR